MANLVDYMVVHRKARSPYFEQAISSLEGRSYFVIEDAGYFPASRVSSYNIGSSEYVSFVDDDDILLDPTLLEQHVALTKPDAVYTNSIIINAKGGYAEKLFPDDYSHDMSKCFNGRTCIHQLIFIKREIAQQASQNALKSVTEHNLPLLFDQIMFYEVALLTDWTYFPALCYGWRQWNAALQLHSSPKCTPWDMLRIYKQKFSSRYPEFINT